MGSSASRASRTAAGASARKYPSCAPPSSVTQAASPSNGPSAPPQAGQATQPGQAVPPKAQARKAKDESLNLDASDRVYASHLRTLGAVEPNPILSHSSTNPADPTTASACSSSSSPVSKPQASSRRPQEPVDASNQPFPVSPFPDPRTNPAIAILEARQRFQEEADREFQLAGRSRSGFEGRQFLDVSLIRQILLLRDVRGMNGNEIEKRLGLKKGVVTRMGPKGAVEGF